MARNKAITRNNEWEAEDDMRTLMLAEVIKSDPARLKRAQEMAEKRLKEMAQVATTA